MNSLSSERKREIRDGAEWKMDSILRKYTDLDFRKNDKDEEITDFMQDANVNSGNIPEVIKRIKADRNGTLSYRRAREIVDKTENAVISKRSITEIFRENDSPQTIRLLIRRAFDRIYESDLSGAPHERKKIVIQEREHRSGDVLANL